MLWSGYKFLSKSQGQPQPDIQEITPWMQQNELQMTLVSWKNIPKNFNSDRQEHRRKQEWPGAEMLKNEKVEGSTRRISRKRKGGAGVSWAGQAGQDMKWRFGETIQCWRISGHRELPGVAVDAPSPRILRHWGLRNSQLSLLWGVDEGNDISRLVFLGFLFLPGFGTTQGTQLIIALERIDCCFPYLVDNSKSFFVTTRKPGLGALAEVIGPSNSPTQGFWVLPWFSMSPIGVNPLFLDFFPCSSTPHLISGHLLLCTNAAWVRKPMKNHSRNSDFNGIQDSQMQE